MGVADFDPASGHSFAVYESGGHGKSRLATGEYVGGCKELLRKGYEYFISAHR